jgi:hypothetical protein
MDEKPANERSDFTELSLEKTHLDAQATNEMVRRLINLREQVDRGGSF